MTETTLEEGAGEPHERVKGCPEGTWFRMKNDATTGGMGKAGNKHEQRTIKAGSLVRMIKRGEPGVEHTAVVVQTEEEGAGWVFEDENPPSRSGGNT